MRISAADCTSWCNIAPAPHQVSASLLFSFRPLSTLVIRHGRGCRQKKAAAPNLRLELSSKQRWAFSTAASSWCHSISYALSCAKRARNYRALPYRHHLAHKTSGSNSRGSSPSKAFRTENHYARWAIQSHSLAACLGPPMTRNRKLRPLRGRRPTCNTQAHANVQQKGHVFTCMSCPAAKGTNQYTESAPSADAAASRHKHHLRLTTPWATGVLFSSSCPHRPHNNSRT